MLIPLLILLATLQPGDKTVPGQPGTDGGGGDQPVKAPVTPEPAPDIGSAPLMALAAAAPHPIITEVLFAVPTGPAGDANKDGKREVAGDEFIELVNPHDKPIQLFGYTLTDSQDPGKGQMKFTFPAFELPAGASVVVFNGYQSTFTPPYGDNKSPPTGPSDAFGGAYVFTMKIASSKMALGNSGDHVMLTAPDGTVVQRVWWSDDPAAKVHEGEEGPAVAAKKKPLIDDSAPALQRTSIQRDSLLVGGWFVSHLESEQAAFSPGVYRMMPVKK